MGAILAFSLCCISHGALNAIVSAKKKPIAEPAVVRVCEASNVTAEPARGPGILLGVRRVGIQTMPTSECYRRQAEICAEIASISGDPTVIARCAAMVQEHLARAAELDAGPDTETGLPVLGGDQGVTS